MIDESEILPSVTIERYKPPVSIGPGTWEDVTPTGLESLEISREINEVGSGELTFTNTLGYVNHGFFRDRYMYRIKVNDALVFMGTINATKIELPKSGIFVCTSTKPIPAYEYSCSLEGIERYLTRRLISGEWSEETVDEMIQSVVNEANFLSMFKSSPQFIYDPVKLSSTTLASHKFNDGTNPYGEDLPDDFSAVNQDVWSLLKKCTGFLEGLSTSNFEYGLRIDAFSNPFYIYVLPDTLSQRETLVDIFEPTDFESLVVTQSFSETLNWPIVIGDAVESEYYESGVPVVENKVINSNDFYFLPDAAWAAQPPPTVRRHLIIQIDRGLGNFIDPSTWVLHAGTIYKTSSVSTNWILQSDWGYTSAQLIRSKCGEDENYGARKLCDGPRRLVAPWKHSVSETHYVVLDFGEAIFWGGIRAYRVTGGPTFTANVYVSENPTSWGAAIPWTIGSDGWNDLTFSSVIQGRFCKIEFTSSTGLMDGITEVMAKDASYFANLTQKSLVANMVAGAYCQPGDGFLYVWCTDGANPNTKVITYGTLLEYGHLFAQGSCVVGGDIETVHDNLYFHAPIGQTTLIVTKERFVDFRVAAPPPYAFHLEKMTDSRISIWRSNGIIHGGSIYKYGLLEDVVNVGDVEDQDFANSIALMTTTKLHNPTYQMKVVVRKLTDYLNKCVTFPEPFDDSLTLGWENYSGAKWRSANYKEPSLGDIVGLFVDNIKLTEVIAEPTGPGTWSQAADYLRVWLPDEDSPSSHNIQCGRSYVVTKQTIEVTDHLETTLTGFRYDFRHYDYCEGT